MISKPPDPNPDDPAPVHHAPRPVVIITGSSGFIGAELVRRLAATTQVIGFDRAGAPYPPPQAECVSVDLTSDASLHRAMERVGYAYGRRIAAVVHLAAYYDFSGEDSPLYDELTVRGTHRLLEALRSFTVTQFIFSSTMLVHRPCRPGEHINEDWPLEPKWPYPESKVRTERLLHEQRGPIKLVNLRIAGVYDDWTNSIPIAHQIQRIDERRLTGRVYPGDIHTGQSFVHLEDVIDAIQRSFERRHELPDEATLLIGEPDPMTYDQVQRTAARLLHDENWETQIIPKTLAKTGAWLQDVIPGEDPFIKPWMVDLADDHYALDITRARQLLGWSPTHTLRDTLPRMIHHLKQDPARWYRVNNLEAPSSVRA